MDKIKDILARKKVVAVTDRVMDRVMDRVWKRLYERTRMELAVSDEKPIVGKEFQMFLLERKTYKMLPSYKKITVVPDVVHEFPPDLFLVKTKVEGEKMVFRVFKRVVTSSG